MGWIIGSIIAVVLVIGCWLIGGAIQNRATEFNDAKQVGRGVQYAGPAIIGVIWLLATFMASVHQVPAGHVGVVYEFGGIVTQSSDGLVITPPWRNIRSATVQVQTLCFVDEGSKCPDGARHAGDGLDSFSTESQNVYIDAIINIEVSPGDVQGLYRNVGPDYVNKLIPGRIAQIFKDETVNYKAVEIAPSRETIRANVEEQLRREMAPYSINVSALLIDNIAFDADFESAILNKQVQTQNALAEQEKILAEEAKAQQAVAQAQGRADSLRIDAQGQADANNLLTQSITPLLVQWQAVQKLSDKIQIALIPSGEGVIIDPATLLESVPESGQ